MNEQLQKLRSWFEHEQQHPRQSVIQALDSLGLRNGDRVADIGCGPGVHLRHFHERVAPDGEVVGIDTSFERLDVAAAMLRNEVERGTIRLIEGDLHNLDSDLGRFDLAWMSLVLHHEEIPVDVIQGLRKIVVPGGRIAILEGDDAASFPFVPWPPDLELTLRAAVTNAAVGQDESRQFGIRFTGRNLLGILQNANLSDTRLHAYADVRHAPLDEWDVSDIQDWFLNSFGNRIRDYLTPADWLRFESHFTPGSSVYLLDRPDFFLIRTWFLGVGTVDEPIG